MPFFKKRVKILSDQFLMGLFNARSIRNKMNYINEVISESNLSILCLTETWLHTSELSLINAALPSTHSMLHVARSDDRRGGGVAVILSECISGAKLLEYQERVTTFEFIVSFYEKYERSENCCCI
jgi:exonuclease III